MKLRSPEDVLEAVPYLLGFEPTECLVALALSGRRQRLGMTLRVDLPDRVGCPAVGAMVVESLRSDGADSVVLVGYGADPATVEDLVSEVRLRLGAAGVTVRDALRVVDGRWRSYLCAEADCCPPDGTAVRDRVGAPGPVGSMAVVAGRQVLADRDAVAATLAPVRGLLRDGMAAALERELDQPVGPPGRTVELVARLLARAEVVGKAVAVGEAPLAVTRAALTVDDAARLIVGLLDVTARDACLDGWQHIADEVSLELGHLVDPAQRPGADWLWAELVRRAVAPGLVAPVATLLAWNRYVHHGGGAVMTIALDRALSDDPDYFMALALQSLLDAAVPPERFAVLIAGRRGPARRRADRRMRR